jgi:small nuclear ribonucleoprotein (snRNP)-like protein
LRICPNPVDRYMNVQLKDAKMTHYTIFNLTGQKVAEGDIKDQKILVSQLKPGVYSIRFSSDKKVLESKFIKR